MNTTLSADTLVTAALWLLALALPLAMLLWMAAQWIAMRSLMRRVVALESLAGLGAVLTPDPVRADPVPDGRLPGPGDLAPAAQATPMIGAPTDGEGSP